MDALPTGVERADAICVDEAQQAGLPNPSQFRAWLSTSNPLVNAKDRIPAGNGPFILPDNLTIVATDLNDLLDGTLLAAINQHADGGPVPPVQVWTGTSPNGNLSLFNCSDWSSTAGPGGFGFSPSSTGTWTDFGVPMTCGSQGRLYCFGPPPQVLFRVEKVLIPTDDPGFFELEILDNIGTTLAVTPPSGASNGDSIETPVDVNNTYTLREAAIPPANPADYTSSIVCLTGGDILPTVIGQCVDCTELTLDVGITDVVCTITNERLPEPPRVPAAGPAQLGLLMLGLSLAAHRARRRRESV